jgi:2-polyprenyl-3-methyl-5-hydroxy-6-metoxy-1,4-benzoquinol methylase
MDHTAWNQHYAEREPPRRVDAHVRLEEEVVGLAPGRALDLACGTGRNPIWLAQHGWDVTAVDFSDVAIAAARNLARESGVEVEWVTADLLAYRPRTEAYDLVTMLFLHLPPAERTTVIARAAGAVAPGGTLLIAGHDRRNLAEGYRGPRDPQVLYSASDVVELLDGFTVVKADALTRKIDTPEGERAMVDALVVARRDGSGTQ